MLPVRHALVIVALALSFVVRTFAQDTPIETIPGGTRIERLPPGTHSPYDHGRGGAIIGGRPGSLRPRVPMNVRPHGAPAGPELPRERLPASAQAQMRIPHSWAILFELEDLGPPGGLTLDQAIDRLVAESITLRAKSLDIPQAQADVLTAGMHANPVVYFDGQLLPYKRYNTVTNPGGPAQYDLNVAYPVDLSGKRQARINVASAAGRVVEALYQDAVRLEIDRLSDAYVDVLVARLNLRTLRDGLKRLDDIQRRSADEKRDTEEADSVRHQIELQRHTIALALIDAEASLRNSSRTLAMILNLPRESVANLQLRGSIDDDSPPPPPVESLVGSALANRPDVVAFRLGFQRAEADVRLSKANRLPDVYALYQPFTYQDNSPFGAPSSKSWAAGATVTVPIFDRNQGNIRRAQSNVEQSRVELQALEQRVVNEVENAYEEYLATQRGIHQIEVDLLPGIEKKLNESLAAFQNGKLDAATYMATRRELDDLGRHYRELLVRHRRSMLNINTAVGVRVLP